MIVVTNLHPCNHAKHLMEYLLEWNVIHRTEEELMALATTGGSKYIFSDETGVNIFLTIRKDS